MTNNRAMFHVDFNPLIERDARTAPRAERRFVRGRIVWDGQRRYVAYDAHSLLEQESELDPARPGKLA